MESEILQPAALVPPPPSSDPSEVAPAPDAAKSDAAAATQSLAEFSDANPGSKRTRHRAKSQQAGPEDVGRIGELTKKLRAAEEELVKYKKPTAVAPEPAKVVQARQAPTAESRHIPIPPVRAAKDDPEPDVTKYDDLTKYNRDLALWGGRETLREARADYEKSEHQRRTTENANRIRSSWVEKWQAGCEKYPDFAATCSGQTQIPEESLINAWILEHKSGADVLYHLQKNPQELSAMLAMTGMDQAEALSLLGQRLTTSTRTQAVTTGAVAANRTQPVVKPPTPVRTATQRTSDDALPDPENLSLADFAEAFPGRRH